MPLTEINYSILQWAKDPRRGILVPTKPKLPSFLQIHPKDKVVVAMMCSDGNKMSDQYGHQCHIRRKVCGHEKTHLCGVAGGPISIAPEPEMKAAFRHRYIGPYTKSQHDLEEIEIGCFAMNTNCVELIGHAPCRLATEAKLNLFQIMRSTVNAVEVVINHLNSCKSVRAITAELRMPVRVDCYLHAEQFTQFKTRAINPIKFRKHHDELEAFIQSLSK